MSDIDDLKLALDAIREDNICLALNILDDCDHEVADVAADMLSSFDDEDIAMAESLLEQEIDNDDSILSEYEDE